MRALRSTASDFQRLLALLQLLEQGLKLLDRLLLCLITLGECAGAAERGDLIAPLLDRLVEHLDLGLRGDDLGMVRPVALGKRYRFRRLLGAVIGHARHGIVEQHRALDLGVAHVGIERIADRLELVDGGGEFVDAASDLIDLGDLVGMGLGNGVLPIFLADLEDVLVDGLQLIEQAHLTRAQLLRAEILLAFILLHAKLGIGIKKAIDGGSRV